MEKNEKTQNLVLPMPADLETASFKDCDHFLPALVTLVHHKCVEISDFTLLLNGNFIPKYSDPEIDNFRIKQFDMYDQYFGVSRTSAFPGKTLIAGFLASLAELADDARKGTSLDPFAVSIFLRSVRVQAKHFIEEIKNA